MVLNALVNGGQEEHPTNASFDIQHFGHVSVQDEYGNKVIISEDESGNLQVYYADHATMTIEGESNEQPQVTIDSDEYPFDLKVMDNEDAIEKLQLTDLNL